MNDVSIALVGAGVIGKRHLLAASHIDGVDIVAVSDPALPRSSNVHNALTEQYEVEIFQNLPAMLDGIKPDGIIVATPTEHHLEPTLAALHSGAHVLVEKPFMADLDECAKAIALTQSSNKHVLVAHQRRYYSFVDTARQLIRDGEIGKLVSVSGQWTMRKPEHYYKPAWRKKWQAGPILTNLIHDMDMLRHIAGEVVSVTAETSNDVLGFEKEDAAAIILRFENGALGTFILSDQAHSPWSWEHGFGENAAFPPSGENSMRFTGTEGSLDFPNLTLWKSVEGESCWNNNIVPSPLEINHEDAYIQQLSHFSDVIRGNAEPRVSAEDATATLRATLAVYESASTGCRVNLNH